MVPKFNEIYKELLIALEDGKEHSVKKLKERVAKLLNLSQEDRKEMVASGKNNKFSVRVSWGYVYLKKAGLVETVRRGVLKITEKGLKALNSEEIINNEYLKQFENFNKFLELTPTSEENENSEVEKTPQDIVEEAFQTMNKVLEEEVLEEVLKQDSDFFEMLVVRLLQKIGYGSFTKEAGIATKKSNDEGIDGIIKEDKLGFDMIYIQAKRWNKDSTIGRPEIQKFVGALVGKGASKGVFITTGKFSKGAVDYSKTQHSTKIVLIDGEELARLMIEYNLGVSVENVYEVKRIDSDFFNELD